MLPDRGGIDGAECVLIISVACVDLNPLTRT